MIKASIFRNKNGKIYGFKIINHGESLVCASVSTLAINTANAIEALTDFEFEINVEEEGGFLELYVKNLLENKEAHDATILLDALFLGLSSIEKEHIKELKVDIVLKK